MEHSIVQKRGQVNTFCPVSWAQDALFLKREPNQSVADRIRLLFEKEPGGHRGIAERLGVVSKSTVGNWLNGTSEPGVSEILAICQKKRVSPNWLLGWGDQAFSEEETRLVLALRLVPLGIVRTAVVAAVDAAARTISGVSPPPEISDKIRVTLRDGSVYEGPERRAGIDRRRG